MGCTLRFLLGFTLIVLCTTATSASWRQIRNAENLTDANVNETFTPDNNVNQKNSTELNKYDEKKLEKKVILKETKPSIKSSEKHNTSESTNLETASDIHKEVIKTTFKPESSRSIDFDISKYVSEEFHNKNNVYTLPGTTDTDEYLKNEFNDFKNDTHNISHFTDGDFSSELTTPKHDYFDSKHEAIINGVQEKLQDIDVHFAKSDNEFSESKENSDVVVEELLEQTKRNGTDAKLDYTARTKIQANDTEKQNGVHQDFLSEQRTNLNFESSYNNTEIIDEEDDDDENNISNNEDDVILEPETVHDKIIKPTTEKSVDSENVSEANKNLKTNFYTTYKSTITKPPQNDSIRTSLLNNKIETDVIKPAEASRNAWFATTNKPVSTTTSKNLGQKETLPYTVNTTAQITIAKRGSIKYQDTTTSAPTPPVTKITKSKLKSKSNKTAEQTVQENQIVPIQVLAPQTNEEKTDVQVISEKDSKVQKNESYTDQVDLTTTTTEINVTDGFLLDQTDETTNSSIEEPLEILSTTTETIVTTVSTTEFVTVSTTEAITTVTPASTTLEVETQTTIINDENSTVGPLMDELLSVQPISTFTEAATESTTYIDEKYTTTAIPFTTTVNGNDETTLYTTPFAETTTDNVVTTETTSTLTPEVTTNIGTDRTTTEENDSTTSASTTTEHIWSTTNNLNTETTSIETEVPTTELTTAVATDSNTEPSVIPLRNLNNTSKATSNLNNMTIAEDLAARNNITSLNSEQSDTTEYEEGATTPENLEVSDQKEEGNGGTIAAIVISSIGGVCLIMLAILLLVMRKRQKRFNYGQRCTPVSLDAYSVDNISMYNSMRRKTIRASKRSYGNPAFDDPNSVTHALNFAGLVKFAMNDDDIKAEFDEIPIVTARASELPEGCETKNRYANVIPLPETRVFLNAIEGHTNSDYINANYVTGPKNTRGYYIATQGPLQNTIDDFWRMIWEQQSKVILMLTHLYENGSEKCVDYLPPSEVLDCHRLFGDFQVTLKRREAKEKYIISNLQLKNMVSNSWREVTHLWYLGWPEKGVPSEQNSLIAFLIEARSYIKMPSTATDKSKEVTSNGATNTEINPVVIHCSPGTGRTGTVIACDIAIREFELTRHVDIPRIVYKIRRDRASSVQTKDQYLFIYKVISLYATKLTGGALDSF